MSPVWNSTIHSYPFVLVFSKEIKVPVRNSQEASFTGITKFKPKGSHPQELIANCALPMGNKCFHGNFLMSLLGNLPKKNFLPAEQAFVRSSSSGAVGITPCDTTGFYTAQLLSRRESPTQYVQAAHETRSGQDCTSFKASSPEVITLTSFIITVQT